MDGASKELKDIITKRLQGAKYGYWHWMEDVWLVSGVLDGVTPKSFSEWLELTPGVQLITYLIIKIGSPSSYWGRNSKEGWDWMHKYWR